MGRRAGRDLEDLQAGDVQRRVTGLAQQEGGVQGAQSNSFHHFRFTADDRSNLLQAMPFGPTRKSG